MRAFASALDAVPLALAENSGLLPIDALAEVKSRQVTENNTRLGIDCSGEGENGIRQLPVFGYCHLTYTPDMKKQFVYDPLISKRQQYLLATQVCDVCTRLVCFSCVAFCSWFGQCSR